MSSFAIRRAALTDASALAELAARTFAETFAADNSPEDLAAHLRSSYGTAQQTAELEDRNVITLLAFQGEALAGFAQVRRKPAPSCVTGERPVELHRFYLTRSAHGTGLAAPLMFAARAAARELEGLHLWLGVWERNPRAIAFYIKSGFAEVGSHVFMVGNDRQTDLVLVSSLSDHVANAG
jgi:GNAT superfamily N-acetyltransferase